MSNSAFQPTVLTIPSAAGGTGQGELNLVTNPAAAVNLDGWVGAGRGTSGGPLNPTITTYFTVLNTAGSESSTSGAYDVISLPSGLQNKKLKVEFYYTSPALDTFKVSVYKGTTRVPLTTDVSGTTSLPQSTTGKFVAYFDTDSSGTWTVAITRTAGTGSTALQFTNVVVGPGIQPQGAVVGEWQSYTGTITGGGTATVAYSSRQYRRVGDSVEIMFNLNVTAAGSGTSSVVIPLPTGLTVDFTKAPNETTLGNYSYYTGTAYVAGGRLRTVTGTTTGVLLQEIGASTLITGADLVNNSAWYMSFTLPIAEWAGSGTVQLAQNDVEYAWNSSTSTTTDDTTSFGYGPGGALIGSITNVVDRTVRFQSPIQSGDTFTVEIQPSATNGWLPVSMGYGGVNLSYSYQNNTNYGLGIFGSNTSNNQVTVRFGTYSFSSSTYGAAGAAWSAGVGSYRWRVRKSSAGAAVGFGIVAPGVSSGLVAAAGLPGRTDGLAVPTGYVGEVQKSSANSQTITSALGITNVTTVSITKGVWLISGHFLGIPSANNSSALILNTTSGTSPANLPGYSSSGVTCSVRTADGAHGSTMPMMYLNSATDVTVYLNLYRAAAMSYSSGEYSLTAVRVG